MTFTEFAGASITMAAPWKLQLAENDSIVGKAARRQSVSDIASFYDSMRGQESLPRRAALKMLHLYWPEVEDKMRASLTRLRRLVMPSWRDQAVRVWVVASLDTVWETGLILPLLMAARVFDARSLLNIMVCLPKSARPDQLGLLHLIQAETAYLCRFPSLGSQFLPNLGGETRELKSLEIRFHAVLDGAEASDSVLAAILAQSDSAVAKILRKRRLNDREDRFAGGLLLVGAAAALGVFGKRRKNFVKKCNSRKAILHFDKVAFKAKGRKCREEVLFDHEALVEKWVDSVESAAPNLRLELEQWLQELRQASDWLQRPPGNISQLHQIIGLLEIYAGSRSVSKPGGSLFILSQRVWTGRSPDKWFPWWFSGPWNAFRDVNRAAIESFFSKEKFAGEFPESSKLSEAFEEFGPQSFVGTLSRCKDGLKPPSWSPRLGSYNRILYIDKILSFLAVDTEGTRDACQIDGVAGIKGGSALSELGCAVIKCLAFELLLIQLRAPEPAGNRAISKVQESQGKCGANTTDA